MAHDRPLSELRSSGMLWLINRVVFHPRGVALALRETPEGEITGWRLLTPDGDEPFTFPDETDTEGFRRAEETFRTALAEPKEPTPPTFELLHHACGLVATIPGDVTLHPGRLSWPGHNCPADTTPKESTR